MCQKRISDAARAGIAAAAWTCLGAAALIGSTARAEDGPDMLTDPFNFKLGTFIITSEPTVQLNGDTLRGDHVNFDEVLGGGDATRVRLDGDWRFGDSQRHKLRLIAFNASRDRSKTLEEEINWGDDTYPIDAKLDSEFKFAVLELAYEYAFLRRDNYEVSGSFGLHYTTLDASLKAQSTTTGDTLNLSNTASVDAPLPVIGARGLWKLPHNFWIDAQAQFFALSIDQYDGSLHDYRLMLTWQPKPWGGIGIGYNGFKIDVDVDGDSFNGSLDWKYNGPMIFYSASF